MSKSKREVILDFTPLLDVMMLILFFFILFTSVNFQNKTEEIEANAQSTISEAEAEAQSAISEAKAELNQQSKYIMKRLKNLRKNLTH